MTGSFEIFYSNKVSPKLSDYMVTLYIFQRQHECFYLQYTLWAGLSFKPYLAGIVSEGQHYFTKVKSYFYSLDILDTVGEPRMNSRGTHLFGFSN